MEDSELAETWGSYFGKGEISWPMDEYREHTTYAGHGEAWDFSTHKQIGIPVRAVKDGVIVQQITTKTDHGAYENGIGNYPGNESLGNYIIVYHDEDSTYSLYAHLTNTKGFPFNVGDKVSEGQVIGYSGHTGNSSGPHLHFEYRKGSKLNSYTDYAGQFWTATPLRLANYLGNKAANPETPGTPGTPTTPSDEDDI